jgi:hypothetical protein
MGLVRVRNWQPNTWPKKRKSKQEARAAQFQRETPSGRAGVTAIESASAWGGDGSAGRAIPVAGRSTDAHFHFFISALDCQSGCNQTGALAEPKASAGSALPRHLQLLKLNRSYEGSESQTTMNNYLEWRRMVKADARLQTPDSPS